MSNAEIKKAVFSINADSARGDDGFTTRFFQTYWEIVENDVIAVARNFFSGGRLLKSFNHTHMCLIPKVNDTREMAQVRPIGLCSMFYKVISKIMVHWMQKFMNRIVTANQSTFVKGRLISENILVAHECMHYLKNKRVGGTFEMILKLDMSKAYDRVEWSFLWFVMSKLVFDR